MRTLSIDIETYSSVSIKDGVYKYITAPDFQILLLAYAFDNEPVQVVDLAQGEDLPEEVLNALHFWPDDYVLTAFNAAFERTCLKTSSIKAWDCTMVRCAMLGLPTNLDGAGKALGITQQKMTEGKALIKFFCEPCKPTKTNGGRTRNLPHHDPARWELFKKYCARDVEAEREIRNKLLSFPVVDMERRLWELDQQINDRGVGVDVTLATNAVRIAADYKARLEAEAISLTGLENPNSVSQLIAWLEREGMQTDSLTKKDVPELLKQTSDDVVTRVLQIRQELGKSSVKKYDAMLKSVGDDGRIRGLLQYYGATRTGRWAGRMVQVQNLPRNEMKELDIARNFVIGNNSEALELIFGNIPDVLSQLIRTAFVAGEGKTLAVCDFSAIEAVVLAWLAGEEWRMDVFRTHGKIYEASASKMFNVPIETIDKKSPLRQKGKVSELALGYQGGPNALITMGALDMGLKESELKPLVDAWRAANPSIVKLWYAMDDAAKRAVDSKVEVPVRNGVSFYIQKGVLSMRLPSGRSLRYPFAHLADGKYGKVVKFKGVDQTTKQWGLQDTYGGKLVENAVQAIARDCLAESMLRINDKGGRIVMHVHDEVIIETADPADLAMMQAVMAEPISWAPGLPLKAEGYTTYYYKKD
jgi:DNA polymerase